MADAPAPTPDAEQQPATASDTAPEAIEAPEAPAANAVEPVTAVEPADEPAVASTVEVPATPLAPPAAAGAGGAEVGDQEGGEFELLLAKLRQWLASGQLQQQWQAARSPLSLLAGLIAVLLVLRLYGALLAVLDGIPLLPGLLELVGVIAVVQFSLTRLVRSDDRRQVIASLRSRWSSFRGRS